MRDPRGERGRSGALPRAAHPLVVLLVLVIASLALATLAGPRAVASEARPAVDDPAMETRVWNLANELRCLVCQNQTIADSHAELAMDLKNQIREQIRAGRTDRQIVDYMVERYGDFVLYRPPVKATTLLLWIGPFVLLAGAFVAFGVQLRRRRAAQTAEPELDAAARARARAILEQRPGEPT